MVKTSLLIFQKFGKFSVQVLNDQILYLPPSINMSLYIICVFGKRIMLQKKDLYPYIFAFLIQ